ncbi:hypothetical protein [Spiroplasma ixodetis]|uniref:Uncharacterized protein n=1 Tax=Spiroplasma ixodetis TaxID=2141 RepID=A0ABN7BSD7_9MOLU
MSEAKKSSLFESIQKSIDSVDKGFKNHDSDLIDKVKTIDNNAFVCEQNKKIVKTISIDQKTQIMLNELKEINNKVNLSQLVRREVFKIYNELILKYK